MRGFLLFSWAKGTVDTDSKKTNPLKLLLEETISYFLKQELYSSSPPNSRMSNRAVFLHVHLFLCTPKFLNYYYETND